MRFFVLIPLFVFASCMKNELGPEAALKEFVESRIGKVIDRDFVLQRVGGKMLQSFKNMSQENFEKFADMKNIKSDSFKVLAKSCEPSKCFITYSVSYVTLKENKPQFSSEVKKIVELVRVENKWLIADVSNIKTYHESLEPINALE